MRGISTELAWSMELEQITIELHEISSGEQDKLVV